MSNFGYLKNYPQFEMFADAAIEAEKVLNTSPAMSAIGSRKAFDGAACGGSAVLPGGGDLLSSRTGGTHPGGVPPQTAGKRGESGGSFLL